MNFCAVPDYELRAGCGVVAFSATLEAPSLCTAHRANGSCDNRSFGRTATAMLCTEKGRIFLILDNPLELYVL